MGNRSDINDEPANGEFVQVGNTSCKRGGLTIRDYFATHAAECEIQQEIDKGHREQPIRRISRYEARYAVADEMLAARSMKPPANDVLQKWNGIAKDFEARRGTK